MKKEEIMCNPEEPEYRVFEYTCPHCGHHYREANSVKKHPDHRKCPKCGKSGKAENQDDHTIYRVLTQLRQHGVQCFLADGLTTEALDSSVKGWG